MALLSPSCPQGQSQRPSQGRLHKRHLTSLNFPTDAVSSSSPLPPAASWGTVSLHSGLTSSCAPHGAGHVPVAKEAAPLCQWPRQLAPHAEAAQYTSHVTKSDNRSMPHATGWGRQTCWERWHRV